jgi:hypothetical protein
MGNEENANPITNPNITIINITNGLNDFHKNFSNRKSWMSSCRYPWRSYKRWLNRMYIMNSWNIRNKNLEKTQRGLQQTSKWNRGDIWSKEIYKIKDTTQEIIEEFNKDMEDLRKKVRQKSGNKISFNQIQTQWKATSAN